MDGIGIVRYTKGDTLIGKWVKNKLNGSAFFYQSQSKQWTHFEFAAGKCAKILEKEIAKNENEIKLLQNFKEYQNLYLEGLIDYLGHLESAERKILDSNESL